MIDRIHLIDEHIPIYFLHGEQSWINIEPSIIAQSKHKHVFVDTIREAGHHVNTSFFFFQYNYILNFLLRFMRIHL
jgi:hypothetical protein